MGAPTREHLAYMYEVGSYPTLEKGLNMSPVHLRPLIHAGRILAEVGDLDRFVHDLGMSLFSPLHHLGDGFASDPAAVHTLFILEMVKWRDEKLVKDQT
jgi:hypothetical protein